MTDEASFQAALDANPDWHDCRLVFADWLEEQGDDRAAGYRWLGENRKRPRYCMYEWEWLTLLPGFCFLPYHLPVKKSEWNRNPLHSLCCCSGNPQFRSRRDAEDVFARIYAEIHRGVPA